MSQIGRPIDEPHTLDLALAVEGAPGRCLFEPAVRAIAKDHLARITSLRDELLSEAVTLY